MATQKHFDYSEYLITLLTRYNLPFYIGYHATFKTHGIGSKTLDSLGKD
jgi:hypothetical protein